MKNAITIHMGASRFDVKVRTEGEPLVFDVYRMSREQKGHFFSEFRRAIKRHLGHKD